MRFHGLLATAAIFLGLVCSTVISEQQTPLLRHARTGNTVSAALFAELEELARIVDISYCVGLTSFGIAKPFKCLSRCSDFPEFELVTTWNTGPLMSDSCGYIALDHGKRRFIVAFRGTYSVANTVVDLSTVPQEYIPYPGKDDEWNGATPEDVSKEILHGIGGHSKRDLVATGEDAKCNDCTVHMGFYGSWRQTRDYIFQDLLQQLLLYPEYQLNLVGHSLGGAVAALAGLELHVRGWDPVVTTFGEPRVGNRGLVEFIDERFDLNRKTATEDDDTKLKYRRVTHVDDPVPLLPLTEWGYAMHAGEVYISKPALSPDIKDLQLCEGDTDQHCIASQDSTTAADQPADSAEVTRTKRDLLSSVQDEVHDVVHEPWGIPSRYKLWQLFFSHRDYFWRLGVCLPGGDPLGGGDGKYD